MNGVVLKKLDHCKLVFLDKLKVKYRANDYESKSEIQDNIERMLHDAVATYLMKSNGEFLAFNFNPVIKVDSKEYYKHENETRNGFFMSFDADVYIGSVEIYKIFLLYE